MEIVIVPAWRRPDFLTVTLRRLAAAGDDHIRYWVCLDRRCSREVARVAARFVDSVGPARGRVVRRNHGYRGNSYNVLTAYREACRTGADLVHLVEEDVFVGVGYFSFHRQTHALCPEVIAVSACRNQFQVDADPPAAPDAVYLHAGYQSLAVSFRPGRLGQVLQHATAAYFADPVQYCRTHFPRSRIPAGNAEQDGLIHRIAEASGACTAYGAVPRAYHAGFVGYHRRGLPLTGPVEDRADRLEAMTDDEMNARAHSYPDHRRISLEQRHPPVTRIITWP